MLLFKRFATLVVILFSLTCWSDDDLASLSNNPPLFSDVTQEVGITFRHFDGRQGNRYFIETIGSGCAFLDYNNDGLMDLYLVNASSYPNEDEQSEVSDHVNQLYRNTGAGGFVLVNAGVEDKGYGTGGWCMSCFFFPSFRSHKHRGINDIYNKALLALNNHSNETT